MNILIIDDSIDKIARITSCISDCLRHFTIESVQDAKNSFGLFSKTQYDLAIIDHFLPDRVGGAPQPLGGRNIADELNRKRDQLFVPKYIIGMTQFESKSENFSPLWQTIFFDIKSDKWERDLKNFVLHISKAISYPASNPTKVLPTIFLEGESDRFYIEKTLEHFYPEISDQLIIKTQPNAGANWVGSQISAWAIRMEKDDNGYIKAVGLLDGDRAGTDAKNEVQRVVITANKKQTFTLLQIMPKYNRNLIDYYRNGFKIDLEIESVLPLEIFEYADLCGWLQNRNTVFTAPPKNWDQLAVSAKEFLITSGITEKQLLYTKQLKMEFKKALCDYIGSCPNTKEILSNYKPLIDDILQALDIDVAGLKPLSSVACG